VIVVAAVITFWSAFAGAEFSALDRSLFTQGRLVSADIRHQLATGASSVTLPDETAQHIAVAAVYFGRGGNVLQTSGAVVGLGELRRLATQAPAAGTPVFTTVTLAGDQMRVVAEAVDPGLPGAGVVVLARPMDDLNRILFEVGALLVLTTVLLIAAATALAHWLAGRAVASVKRIAATARDLSEHDLHRRVEVLQADDEFGDLAETFNSMLARLESAFESLRHFTADAAHELRAPLAIMRTDLEVALGRARTPAQYRQTLTAVLAEVENLTRMTDQLLLLAQADAGSLAVRSEPIDIVDFVEETVERWRATAASRDRRIQVSLPASGQVRGDPMLLRRVLDNLIDNALRFSPAGQPVVVAAEAAEGGWRITVADTGPGVEPAMRAQLFRRFARADPARQRTTGGAGLGLALCSAIVELHDGTITLEDGAGRGARFAVLVPAAT